MHKKYNKYGKRDLLHKPSSTHKRAHRKHKKESNDLSLNELINVPQNSKCDIKNYCGDMENTDKLKASLRHKEKHKHKKVERSKSTEQHGKKHEKQSNHNVEKEENLLFQNERLVKHKENHSKKEKRDKERLNNIEKYLEGLNEICHKSKVQNRSSVSLRSTENLEKKRRHIRREKTFHGEIAPGKDPSESHIALSEAKRLRDQKRREKEMKKQKHRENKGKDSNKEKYAKESSKQLFHCQVGNPMVPIDKSHGVEKPSSQLNRDDRKRSSSNKIRNGSSSKGRSKSPRKDEMKIKRLEKLNSQNRDRSGHSKEKKNLEKTKHSQRKSKNRENHKSTKESKDKVNLGPFDKYFVIDKKSESDDENKCHRKLRRAKNKETFKRSKIVDNKVSENMLKEERRQRKIRPEKNASKIKEATTTSTHDQFRDKIEDDIKSYFLKIQTLIDKKLEYILHGSSRGSNKMNDSEKENSVDDGQSKKQRRSKSKEEKQARRRSKSMDKHMSRKHKSPVNMEQLRSTHRSPESMLREERKLHEEEYKHHRHQKSLTKIEKKNLVNHSQNNETDLKHEKRHSSPKSNFHEVMPGEQLLNMLENPSAYSIKSKKSITGDKSVNKEMNIEQKLRTKHAHKEINNDNNQNRTHRESSLVKENIVPDEVTCLGTANDFCLVDAVPPAENHSKRHRKRPLNLECKTVSIIGIPSQIKESIIFNETQTTTSLNVDVVNSVEEPVERKKKTKRFKLYYKYSLANSSCAKSGSDDNNSEGKSILSDSYRFVSGNSAHSSEVGLTHNERDLPTESRKIVFVMRRESLANVSGDTSDNQFAIEQFSRKCRTHRTLTPVTSKLNNIVEEPSNMSCLEELDKTLQSMSSDFHCKYFNILNSSSSACNLHLLKKSAISDWNIPMGRCKCRIFDNPNKVNTVKVAGKKAHEEASPENKLTRQTDIQRCEKTTNTKFKIKQKKNRDFGQKYSSKSDIDISYDSLHTDKHHRIKRNKNKKKVNLSSHLIENSNYTPTDISTIKNQNVPATRHHSPSDRGRADPIELQLKESVCQTESEIYKEAIEELIISKAYQKYFDILQSHNARVQQRQNVANNKEFETNTEANRSQIKKKGTYPEFTRIPSLLNRRPLKKSTPALLEINNPTRGSVEDFPQKHFKRSLIPEKINPILKPNQKKLVDIGVDAVFQDDKSKRREGHSPNRKKSFEKIDVNIDAPKPNFNKGVERNDQENLAGLAASKYSPTPRKHNCQTNRDPPRRSIFQQSKRLGGRATDVARPVRLLTFPKVSPSIISGRCKFRKKERLFSAIEKSSTEKSFLGGTFIQEVKRSTSAIDKIKKPSATDIKKKPRLVVKCTKPGDVPTKKCVAINTSRLTVPESNNSNKTRKQSHSNSCSHKSRNSNKCVDLTMARSINTFSGGITGSEESKVTSLVDLDKFNYGTKINLNSTSNTRSFDQFTMRSIHDQCNSSRLFLTKDYIPQLNTYQRRKLYSESLRRKMKKHSRLQEVIAPQVFEVRYLTYEKEARNDESQVPNHSNATSNTRKCVREKTTPRTSYTKKSRKHVIRSRENAKFSTKDPFLNIVNDVDSLTKYRKRQFPEVKIEDIFIKGDQTPEEKDSNHLDTSEELDNNQNSSVIIREDTNWEELKLLGHNSSSNEDNFDTETNFMHLIDYLCKSIVNQCGSNITFSQLDQHGLLRNGNGNCTNISKQPVDANIINDNVAKHQATLSTIDSLCEKSLLTADKRGCSGRSEKVEASPLGVKSISCVYPENTNYLRQLSNDQRQVSSRLMVTGNVSCPALAGTASSFEFLYEDDSSKELSKQAVLEGLTKPWDTILGYALHYNDAVIIHKEAYTSMGNRIDQISNSPTDSGESGYSSNSSRKCSSATSFFKKPYVAALLKPLPILEAHTEDKRSEKSLAESNDCRRAVRYDLMSKECHEYAQKVRIHSESVEESKDTFQEIPLNVLLRRNKSTVLGQCNSDCSICGEYFDYVPSENERENKYNTEFLEEDSFDTVGYNENNLETLIYYGSSRCKPSLEMIKLQKSRNNFADVDECIALEQELNEYPMIVSNTNLHRSSLTLIDARQSKDCTKEDPPPVSASTKDSSEISNNELDVDLCASTSFLCHVMDPIESISNVKDNDNEIIVHELDDTVTNTDVASDVVTSYSVSASETKKLMAKKFFENLLRVYEKEIAVTTQLFQDDDFFVNDLLSCVTDAEEKKKRKGNRFKKIIKGKIKGYIENVFAPKNHGDGQSLCTYDTEQSIEKFKQFETINQRKLKTLAFNARKYFSMFVQAVTANKDINDEIKICGLLKILQRIENGDFTILRANEEVNFENEIKLQVKEAFINIYEISVKEAKKYKRSLTIDDLKLIKAFVSKYRIGLLSKTDIIATYIGRGIIKNEKHLSAAVTYLIRIQSKDVDLKEFEEYCNVCTCTKK